MQRGRLKLLPHSSCEEWENERFRPGTEWIRTCNEDPTMAGCVHAGIQSIVTDLPEDTRILEGPKGFMAPAARCGSRVPIKSEATVTPLGILQARQRR